MISSALCHYLTMASNDISNCKDLRLFSDSCYGQTKNINLLSMLFSWKAQLKGNFNITYTFPVRGHSFLPADRVFGRIDQNLKSKNTILMPEEYVSTEMCMLWKGLDMLLFQICCCNIYQSQKRI